MLKVTGLVLAAGKSIRMRSAVPKVLHEIAGRPLVSYPIEAARKAGANSIYVVVNKYNLEDFKEIPPLCKGRPGGVEKSTSPTPSLQRRGITFVTQKEARGTADAVMSARPALKNFDGYILIIPGDVPLITPDALKEFIKYVTGNGAACGVLTMELKDPSHYGRIIRDGSGRIKAIVEACDAAEEQLKITEVNSGIYCLRSPWVFEALSRVRAQNAKGEYYLTDLVGIAVGEDKPVVGLPASNPAECLGINTRQELAEAGRQMRVRILDRLMSDGVGILDPLHTYIDCDVVIESDTTIAPHTFIKGKTRIGKGSIIENGAVISDSVVGDGVTIKPYSVIDQSVIKDEAQVGPFARLRPGTVIERGARVGNFVEIKKSRLKAGAKANHLTYIGDALIGARVNVGCGTITCNYDGKNKHKTVIGDDVFVGSDVQFIAPVKIGKGAVIGAGSVITDDVPPGALAVARGKQVIKKNWRKL